MVKQKVIYLATFDPSILSLYVLSIFHSVCATFISCNYVNINVRILFNDVPFAVAVVVFLNTAPYN